ncbi:MAG: ABC transporter substrate-binding protein [Clostridiales bacterium]|nr:ABC transporter substrate-binding protein [Clostridiales bacterium]
MKRLLSIVFAALIGAGLLCGCNDSPKGKVEELEELKGRVVYSIGQGQVPDLVFRYLLKEAGVEYRLADTPKEGVVSLAYVGEGTEIVGGLAAGKMQYGVLSEPAATVALGKAEGVSRMLDIQALYNKVTGSKNGYPQAALVVKKEFLAAHPGYVADFVAKFKEGAKWAETEPAAALEQIMNAGSTSVPVLTAEIAKGCNLGFTAAADCKKQLVSFYEGLDSVKDAGTAPVGAKLPNDDFYQGEITGESEAGVRAKVYAPDGAPAISIAKMIYDGFDADFSIVPPANIVAKVMTDADIAIMPTNAAAAKADDAGVVMLGVTNFGSLYMLGKE